MARAYLNISKEITDAFIAAQENLSIRFLKIRVQGEELILSGIIETQGSVESDFEGLLPESLGDNEACLVLFRLVEGKGSASNWLMIAWVPDGCRVRDKMLYSSSREDLKKAIGVGYFKAEYGANLKTDFTWTQLQSSLNTDDKAIYSYSEMLIKEEKALTQVESNATKSIAMGVLPLAVPPETKDSFQEFSLGTYNFLEVCVVNEVIVVSKHLSLSADQKLQEFVSNDDARFYITTQQKPSGELMTIFVYSCPENIPIKSKMTMSSSKATVLSVLKESGLSIDKTIEVRDANEIDDTIKAELEPAAAAGAVVTALAHSKPARPGRATKARVSKFQADEDV